MTGRIKKEKQLVMKITVGILIVTCLFVAAALYLGDVTVRFDEESMNIRADILGNRTLPYSDISTVSYAKELEIGERTGGVGSFKLQAGNYKNEAFGAYHLYSYTKCHEYVVMDTVNGKMVVNAGTPKETRMLYEEIAEKVQ